MTAVLLIAAIFAAMLILRPIVGEPGGDEPAGPTLADPTAPLIVDGSLRIGSGDGYPPLEIGCGRVDADRSPYVVQITNPPPDARRLGVEVDLQRSDGSRVSEIVDIGMSADGNTSRFEIASPADADDFAKCIIVAIQIDSRLIRTGR